MKSSLKALVLFVVAACASSQATQTAEPEGAGVPAGSTKAAALVGRWRVDLRYQPTSAANWRELNVASVEAEEPPEGGRAITMSGVFHDAAISDGYLNDVWGTVHFALITNDGAGDYATSGVLLNDGTIEGVTHSIGNGFLAPWTAARFDVETEVPADVPANGSVAQADVRQIMGSWQVDLRPQPDAAPYIIPFELRQDAQGKITGSFYGSVITDLHLNVDWGDVHVAFTTRDGGGGTYYTFAKLIGERLVGRTLARDRRFLSPWTGTRE